MNTIEDRLRHALRERAAHSSIDPDAWEQTVARVRRPAELIGARAKQPATRPCHLLGKDRTHASSERQRLPDYPPCPYDEG